VIGPDGTCTRWSHNHAADPEPIECPRCEGTGSVTGDRFLPVDCSDCGGQGITEAER